MTWPLACVRQKESLANHTSFRIGGPAEWFAEPSTVEELIEVLRSAYRLGLPVSIVGGGTNTLAADRGVRGLIVHLGRNFRTIIDISSPDGASAWARCGGSLTTRRLVTFAAQEGWGDLEALAGLPGYVSGAVVMNAQNIGRFVRRITHVAPDGTLSTLQQNQLHFGYRYAALPPGILVDVTLEFPKVPPSESSERIHSALLYRNSTQETGLPSAGCAFKNPPGMAAGKMIDQAGLKGTRIGDAQVSLRHANFIVNVGQASCDDVLSLMEYIQRRVLKNFQVLLQPEVRMIGEATL